MCRLGKAKVLSNFLCPALPNRPHQTVVVVKSGQDGLSQTLYLQKWPKSVFEIVVRVERKKISAVNDPMVLAMFPLIACLREHRSGRAGLHGLHAGNKGLGGGNVQKASYSAADISGSYCRRNALIKCREGNLCE